MRKIEQDSGSGYGRNSESERGKKRGTEKIRRNREGDRESMDPVPLIPRGS